MTINTAVSLQNTLQLIVSPNEALRLDGWNMLRTHAAEFRTAVDAEKRTFLGNLLAHEDNPKVHQAGILALLEFPPVAALPPVAVTPVGQPTSGTLANWLWAPFLKSSAVFAVTGAKYRRRDEGAVLWLRGRLSLASFPHTRFPQISVEEPTLSPWVSDPHFRSFCFVGRAGLFGAEIALQLDCAALQFRFKKHRRPDGLPPDTLDAEYHSIWEANHESSYPTANEADGSRSDYGVVQRYEVKLGSVRVVIVVVAGASSLGTLGAAEWAAKHVFDCTDPVQGSPILLPKSIAPRSRMEALLHVRSKLTRGVWEHPEISLRKLYVDNQAWDAADAKWHCRPPGLITLVYDQDDVVAIHFDNQPAKLRRDSENFRLLAAMARMKYDHPTASIDVKQLGQDKSIWGAATHPEKYVRRRLAYLRVKYFNSALTIADLVWLHADVRVVNIAELNA